VSVLSRRGSLDVSLLSIPAVVAQDVLKGYVQPDKTAPFALAERHTEPPSTGGSSVFRFETVHRPLNLPQGPAAVEGWAVRFPHWLPRACCGSHSPPHCDPPGAAGGAAGAGCACSAATTSAPAPADARSAASRFRRKGRRD
jgi:hypothetical protein